jgi:putative ABC transport system permease protein
MLKNYLKVAWRNLMKNKTFSFINIFGLAIGFTCCLLISLYIYNELSYDTYHKDGDRIYQLGSASVLNGKEERRGNTSAPLAKAMQQEYPEIEASARLMKLFTDDKTLLQYSEPSGNVKSFYETRGYLADSSFFKILTYNFKEGNSATALAEPNSIVLSDEIAQKLFGRRSALDKIIHVSSSTNGDQDFKVTGVYMPFSTLSHIDARFILSLKGGHMEQFANNSTSFIFNNMFYTYFLLKPGADVKKLEAKFPAFINKYMAAPLKDAGIKRSLFLTPVKAIHLQSDMVDNVTPSGSITYLYILGSIAVLTLFIACINFMNLSTSRSSRRAAEVGVRKTLGAGRASLVRQFLGEALIIALIAFGFALLFTYLLLPFFEQVSGKELALTLAQCTPLLLLLLVLVIITGLTAGSYPAFYLSSFQPVKVLKGRFSNSLAAVALRKGLVVFQFVISVALIVASVVITSQMRYLRSKDLGFAKDQQVVIPLRTENAKSLYGSLRNEISRQPGIISVGASYYYPGIFNPQDWLMYKQGETMKRSKDVYINHVDTTLLQTLEIQPVAGRMFSSQYPADTSYRIILNEKAIQEFGFRSTQEAIGKWVAFDWNGQSFRFDIIGVVRDFHFKDLHTGVQPYGFVLDVTNFNYLIAHTKKGDPSGTLKSLESTWRRLNPNEPFEYSFLEQDFQKNYLSETRLAGLINYFTIIAILISCLGLFGLAAFSAEQRTKEIGIRKVMGASVANITALLSKDFLKLVAVAVVIACPIAWYLMDKWLQNFAYRITISVLVFMITALIAVFIALFTISFQAIRAALTNPVENLRSE